jgi:hypothetical protein
MLKRARVICSVCLATAAGLAGCVETPYTYRPTELATATEEGQVAARYSIPPESPRGDVRVASRGINELKRERQPELRAVHVRLVISNDGDTIPWSVDTSELTVEIPGYPPLSPTVVEGEQGPTPQIVIPPRRERTIDLYYGLPADLDEDDVAAFSLLWRVHAGQRVIAERTPFERAEIPWGPETPWILGRAAPGYEAWPEGPFFGGSGAIVREPLPQRRNDPAYPGWAR